MSQSDKVVLVTGAGGLGTEIARQFGAAGAKVAIVDRFQEASDRAANVVNGSGGEGLGCRADLRSIDELKLAVDAVIARWGKLDTVVNTAGGTLAMIARGANKSIMDHSSEEWSLVLDINLTGSFNVLKAVVPPMLERKSGHIILVASGAGMRPGKNLSSYAAAKAGVIALTKAAAIEFGAANIRVNAVNPGLITHEQLELGGYNPEGYRVETMLGRLSTPQDLAQFVVFLSDAESVSGQIYNVDSRVLI